MASALKVALFVAVCIVLLHSSMGQQPAPAPAPVPPIDCYNQCTSDCLPRCQAIADSDYRKCSNVSVDVYASCLQGCSVHCNGNSAYARGSCAMGSCAASTCGCPCVQDCCKACTIAAGQAAYACTSAAGRVMQFCMPDCPNYCANVCASVSSAPPPPAP